METLILTISAYKKATQTLLNKINDLEEDVRTSVPDEFWKEFNLKSYKNALFTGVAFTVPVFNPELGHTEYRPIPPNTEDLGKFLKWADCTAVSGADLIKWAKNLPELVKKVEQHIQQLTNEAENI